MIAEKGFTLIELMVVVAIIGILSLIGIPAYQKYAKQSSEMACLAETKAFSDKLFIDIITDIPIAVTGNPPSLSIPESTACKSLKYIAETTAANAKLATITGVIENPRDKSKNKVVCTLGDVVSCVANVP